MAMQKKIYQIADKIFQINIPHFYGRFVNVYILLNDTVSLVDTGHIHSSSLECLEKTIRYLGYELTDIGYIIYTHPHIDHAGGGFFINSINTKIINIAFLGAVGIFARYRKFLDKLLATANDFFEKKAKGASPFLIEKSKKFFRNYNNAFCNSQEGLVINRPVKEADIIKIGDMELRVIHTPSHTPWDISFYEPNKGILFTGDFIVEKGISLLSDITESDVDSYIHSLHKIKRLRLKVILPGHGRIIHSPDHHIETSLNNIFSYEQIILNILKGRTSTLAQITNFLMREKADDYNRWYRFLSLADTILTKLLRKGMVFRKIQGGKVYYSHSYAK